MTVKIIQTESSGMTAVEQAAAVLRTGGVIIHATETVYGLAAKYDDFDALKRVRDIKRRDEASPFSIMLWDAPQILHLSGQQDRRLERFIRRIFPGPVTLVLQNRGNLPGAWAQLPTLGFRVPDHPLSRALAEKTGTPLITTSANRSGCRPVADCTALDPAVVSAADLLIDSGPCPLKTPSTVFHIDLSIPALKCLREGALPVSELEKIFDICFK